MRKLDNKKDWVPKNWCFWTMVLEKTLGSPMDCKEIKPVNLKGNQSWIFFGRTDAEAEAPILWPHDGKSQIIGKDMIKGEIESRKRRGWQRMRWLYASLTQGTCVWASSRRWWWTGKPGMLQSMGLQTVGHDWVTEPQQRSKIKLTWIFLSN